MDIGFFAFVVAIALMAAIGATLLLVGYIVVVPARIVRGCWWAALVVLSRSSARSFSVVRFPRGWVKRGGRFFTGRY